MLKVKIKKLHPNAVIPNYATPGSSGFDLHTIEHYYLEPGETRLIRTGLTFELPPNTEIQIRPRSSLSLKTGLRIVNSPGTIDEDFRGEVCIIAQNINNETNNIMISNSISIMSGDRIAQGVLVPVLRAEFEEVTELSETERGTGGFGSSGT